MIQAPTPFYINMVGTLVDQPIEKHCCHRTGTENCYKAIRTCCGDISVISLQSQITITIEVRKLSTRYAPRRNRPALLLRLLSSPIPRQRNG